MRYASLRQGLVGCWCPSVSGSFGYRLPDLSGRGNHGTLTNMDPGSDWVVSGGKGALDFDGSNDYVATSDKVWPQNACTISLWFNISTKSTRVMLSNWTSVSPVYLQCFTVNDGSVTCRFYSDGGNGNSNYIGRTTTTNAFAINSWNFLTAIWYGGTTSASVSLFLFSSNNLYRDVSDSVSGSFTSIQKTARPMWIGTQIFNSSTNNPFIGQLDDIRIYNRALSESEIRLLASERGIGLKPERLRNRYSAPVTTPSRNRSSRFLGFPA